MYLEQCILLCKIIIFTQLSLSEKLTYVEICKQNILKRKYDM